MYSFIFSWFEPYNVIQYPDNDSFKNRLLISIKRVSAEEISGVCVGVAVVP